MTTNNIVRPLLSLPASQSSSIRDRVVAPPAARDEDASASSLCVPDLVRQRAEFAPGAVALRSSSGSVSFRDLDQRSSRLAHYLISLGVAPGSIVGIYLERSIDFAVTALSVFKAGAAYLPLDPSAPTDRLSIMLREVSVSLVVTRHNLPASLAADVRVCSLDQNADEVACFACDTPPIQITREQLAYVIYTSGSTGTPKAVAVSHGSLVNLVEWHNRAFSVKSTDVATQFASIGFDAAVWELWPHLVAGASVCVVDDDVRADSERLRDWLIREGVTISFVPTLLAERLMQLAWPPKTALRFLLTGADTLHHYPSKSLPFAVVNNYGPTECTVVATSAVVSPPENASGLPPIGRPIDNTRIFILDSNLKQLPAGQIGEMYVGGAGLAQGYLNDAALTAERFIPNPLIAVTGDRLYRTGDLGCYLPDGQLAFHGRVDDQVKIRGYRIELNEVIGALSRHPAVRESVVVTTEDSEPEKRLVAYVVPKTDSLTVSELRDFLARELPNYMIPSIFVRLEKLPIGTSGKVNRPALPAPTEENMLRDEAFVGASTPTEQRVAEVVTSLLGLESIGVNDNFFYFGGNSLFGTQVIARLREVFQVEMPLLRLFDYPTVGGLAVEVERLMVAKLDAMSEEEAQRLLALLERPAV
jgi:amino acid adenylation domain-containing protein